MGLIFSNGAHLARCSSRFFYLLSTSNSWLGSQIPWLLQPVQDTVRAGVLCRCSAWWKCWVITCVLALLPPSPLKKNKQSRNTHSTARWNLRVVLASFHGPGVAGRGVSFSFLSSRLQGVLPPDTLPHPAFEIFAFLGGLFRRGCESTFLEPRLENFSPAHNLQQYHAGLSLLFPVLWFSECFSRW